MNIQDKTFLMRIEHARKNKSEEFTMTAGKDLKQSLLMMFNQMKNKLVIPECLRTAHVTILHKKKCRLDLNNWRAIFVCSVLRTVLMKIIYERTYPKVEKNMTDSQIGARKKKCKEPSFHFEFHFK